MPIILSKAQRSHSSLIKYSNPQNRQTTWKNFSSKQSTSVSNTSATWLQNGGSQRVFD